jgi:hypothetical protein
VERILTWKVFMQPEEVEQMLYDHAIRTKIRAPLPERLSNLGYSRIVTSGLVAGAALICSLVMSKSTGSPFGGALYGGMGQPQLTDNNASKTTNFHHQGENTPSLAMSPVGG